MMLFSFFTRICIVATATTVALLPALCAGEETPNEAVSNAGGGGFLRSLAQGCDCCTSGFGLRLCWSVSQELSMRGQACIFDTNTAMAQSNVSALMNFVGGRHGHQKQCCHNFCSGSWAIPIGHSFRCFVFFETTTKRSSASVDVTFWDE